MTPTSYELCYLAGHFDGEGTIYTARAGGVNYSYVHIAVGCTFKPVLDRYQLAFGGKIYSIDRQKSHHKRQWRWAIGHRRVCAKFLTMMIPHLHEKRQLAIDSLEIIKRSYEAKARRIVQDVNSELDALQESDGASRLSADGDGPRTNS